MCLQSMCLCRYDSGLRDSGQMEQVGSPEPLTTPQEPHLEKAINSVRFVAQHVKNQDRYNKVGNGGFVLWIKGGAELQQKVDVKLCRKFRVQ